MASGSTRLSVRADKKTLKVFAPPAALSFADLIRGEACQGAWRIVDAVSGTGAPFELRVSWSAGDGAGQEAKLTVARGTRFSIFASSVVLRAANLSSRENSVSCMVSEGYCVSENHYEVRGEGSVAGASAVEIPPYARLVRLDTAPASGLLSSALYLDDGVGTTRVEVPGDDQPVGGLPLAGAGALSVLVPSNHTFRVTFTLSL